MNILIIDAEKKLAKKINHELGQDPHEISHAADGEAGLKLLLDQKFDLILLDWNLPRKDGVGILKEIRMRKNLTPVLMLTTTPSLNNTILSLSYGANDCLAKSSEMRVIVSRMKALVRRSKLYNATEIQYANIRLDLVGRKACDDRTEILLSPKEYGLLEYFVKNSEQVVTRRMIAQDVWGDALDSFTNIIDVYVNYLRKKIDYRGSRKLIHTIRGVGYLFSETH